MSSVAQILSEIEEGDPNAADKLLPLVYDEVRGPGFARLATIKTGRHEEKNNPRIHADEPEVQQFG